MKTSFAVLAAFGFAVPAVAQTMNEVTVSTDAAIQVATAALAACRADGQRVSVTVVDHAGREKVQLRDDGAAPHTEVHSFRKAYTALTYKMPSEEYGKRVKELTSIGPVLLPNITTAAGGVPIRAGDRVVGAVGISGTPGNAGGGEHDAKCAAAGILKVFK
ncbi:MAG: heme-binding protein [Betaproteobacteria bacterium]|nr:heme-binding protein [Betaproteobacteria bacterium]MBV9359959.1 heme-binding protein [Betaproteobacteria bacterium]